MVRELLELNNNARSHTLELLQCLRALEEAREVVLNTRTNNKTNHHRINSRDHPRMEIMAEEERQRMTTPPLHPILLKHHILLPSHHHQMAMSGIKEGEGVLE
jgi:hypothetical protein